MQMRGAKLAFAFKSYIIMNVIINLFESKFILFATCKYVNKCCIFNQLYIYTVFQNPEM